MGNISMGLEIQYLKATVSLLSFFIRQIDCRGNVKRMIDY